MSNRKGTAMQESNPAEVILSHYLLDFKPVASYEQGVHVVTTNDIIADLSDMMDMEPNDVANFMVSAGYRPGRNDTGSFGWMMRSSK